MTNLPYSPKCVYIRQSGPGLLLDAVYHVRMKTVLLTVVGVLVVQGGYEPVRGSHPTCR